MLSIRNLHAEIQGKEILKGLDLELGLGEVHAIMGPNGSGKSTLSYVLAGRPGYEVTQGEIYYKDKDLLRLSVEERAGEGVFLAFQYPVEIPGVSGMSFLRTAVNSMRKYRGEEDLSAAEFLRLARGKASELGMDQVMLNRAVNVGFSGGEKKRNEVLQMALLEPVMAILDETDSGLDIDALRVVAAGVNQLAGDHNATVLITHYQRLLDEITPDFVHVMAAGRILRTGGRELAQELEQTGYDWVDQELAVQGVA